VQKARIPPRRLKDEALEARALLRPACRLFLYERLDAVPQDPLVGAKFPPFDGHRQDALSTLRPLPNDTVHDRVRSSVTRPEHEHCRVFVFVLRDGVRNLPDVLRRRKPSEEHIGAEDRRHGNDEHDANMPPPWHLSFLVHWVT